MRKSLANHNAFLDTQALLKGLGFNNQGKQSGNSQKHSNKGKKKGGLRAAFSHTVRIWFILLKLKTDKEINHCVFAFYIRWIKGQRIGYRHCARSILLLVRIAKTHVVAATDNQAFHRVNFRTEGRAVIKPVGEGANVLPLCIRCAFL